MECDASPHRFPAESSGALIRSAVGQRQNSRSFPRVIEGMKPLDFIQATNAIKRLDSRELRQRNNVLSYRRVGCRLTDPIAGRQGNVSVQQEIGGNRIDPYHRELQEICFVTNRHDVAHWGDNLVCLRALLVGRQN